ncbi:MAG: GGDEF domain-containing protein [Chromatiales bacterium]|nr:GGDEF domain-containing protein [Chromatiales bacterium]
MNHGHDTHESAIRMAQLGLYVDYHRHDLYTGPAFGVFAALVLLTWHPWWVVLPWFLATVAAAFFADHRYRGLPADGDGTLERYWSRRIALAHAPHMLIWASLVLWAWVPGDPLNHLFIILISAGGVAATAAMSSPHRFVFGVDMLLIVPALARPLVEGGTLYYGIAGLAAIFCVLMFGVGRQVHVNVNAMLRLRRDKDELIAELEHLATTDPLTGVLNRRRFWELAQEEFSRARRYQRALSLLVLDIDHFKNINDTHGHPVGDQVIRTVAEFCIDTARSTDVVARLGGEEFAILLPETPLANAETVAERLRQMIGSSPIGVGDLLIPLTASIGVAELDAEDADFDALVLRTDRALYEAKGAGRDRVATG